MTTIVVMAKETVPGRVKTRLSPPFSHEQAARLAAAALADTLAIATALPAGRRILAFDGTLLPPGAGAFEVIPQVDGGLDLRLGAVFDRCDGPTVLIGMDTPQLTCDILAPLFDAWPDDVDAWLGPANDGGYWAIALARPDGDLVRGVPMSRVDTGRLQRERLVAAGLSIRDLPELVDIDTADDALAVARAAPDTGFARALGRLVPVTR